MTNKIIEELNNNIAEKDKILNNTIIEQENIKKKTKKKNKIKQEQDNIIKKSKKEKNIKPEEEHILDGSNITKANIKPRIIVVLRKDVKTREERVQENRDKLKKWCENFDKLKNTMEQSSSIKEYRLNWKTLTPTLKVYFFLEIVMYIGLTYLFFGLLQHYFPTRIVYIK